MRIGHIDRAGCPIASLADCGTNHWFSRLTNDSAMIDVASDDVGMHAPSLNQGASNHAAMNVSAPIAAPPIDAQSIGFCIVVGCMVDESSIVSLESRPQNWISRETLKTSLT
jgi:hypothetical protein